MDCSPERESGRCEYAIVERGLGQKRRSRLRCLLWLQRTVTTKCLHCCSGKVSGRPTRKTTGIAHPLLYAAEEGHEAVVKLLLHAGIPQDSARDGFRTPLSYAAEKGHTAVVALLLWSHANPNLLDGEARTPLSYAAEGGHEAVIKPPVGSRCSSVDQR